MKSIAVLLTVFNRKEGTLRCLANLRRMVLPDGCRMDVYLTNDGCTDGTPEAVRAQFPEVKVIDGDGTLYWNRGMYTAWEAAAKAYDYDYYLWLNDDTFVYREAITSLVSCSETKDDRCIIVGATVDTATRQRMTYGGRLKGKGLAPVHGGPVAVDYFNGNIVLVPASVYHRLGNLDRYFTHSKGDFDYGLRAGKAGIGIFQCGTPLGECDLHPRIDRWCDPAVPLKQRWALLNRPNGMPPHETFHLEKRHYGIGIALFHYVTIVTRCLVPGLWVVLGKAKLNEG